MYDGHVQCDLPQSTSFPNQLSCNKEEHKLYPGDPQRIHFRSSKGKRECCILTREIPQERKVEMMLNMPPCASLPALIPVSSACKVFPFSLRFYFPSSKNSSPHLFFFFFFFSPFGPNHCVENVKPAVWVCYQTKQFYLTSCFCQKIFSKSSWKSVRLQWLSAAFPSSISPGFLSTALSNWILFEEEGEKNCCTRQLVDLRTILWVLKARDRRGSVAKLQGWVTVCHF